MESRQEVDSMFSNLNHCQARYRKLFLFLLLVCMRYLPPAKALVSPLVRQFRVAMERAGQKRKLCSSSLLSDNDGQDIKKNLVIVIAGVTGVGKSDVAATLCKNNGGVIVSADSVQAYHVDSRLH